LAVAQPAGERDLQLLRSSASASASAAAAPAAASAASGDADVPGWFGDLGNGHLSGSAASASAAASGARARLTGATKERPARAFARAGFSLPARHGKGGSPNDEPP